MPPKVETMKQFNVKAFGITRDILGGNQKAVRIDGQTVADLRAELLRQYPQLVGLRSLFIAVNSNYAEESAVLNENDEIALIPPVSGG